MLDNSCKELRAEFLPQIAVTVHKEEMYPRRISPDTTISAPAICHSKTF